MKKILLSSIFIVLIAAGNLFAGNADLFSYDKDELNKEFTNLSLLENYVKSNDGVTLTNLLAQNNPLIAGITVNNPLSSAIPFGEPPLGIGSFWWGCVFGVFGVALVYFVADDKDETMTAFKGCVVGYLIVIVFYVAFYVWIFGNAGLWAV